MRIFSHILASVLLMFQMFLWFTPEIEIKGNVRLVGTPLFPILVISGEDGIDYYFHDDLFDEFRLYNNKAIKIKAKVKDKKTELADGSKIFITPTIYKASIISD